jgi:hypothetical protein
MDVIPGAAVAGSLAIGAAFPLLLVMLGHGPLRLESSGRRFRVAALLAFACYAGWCLAVRKIATPDLIAGALLMSAVMLVWMQVFGLLVWGLSISMLSVLNGAGRPLTRMEWIGLFTAGRGADLFGDNRLRVLMGMGMARIEGERFILTPFGRLTALGLRVSRTLFGLR